MLLPLHDEDGEGGRINPIGSIVPPHNLYAKERDWPMSQRVFPRNRLPLAALLVVTACVLAGYAFASLQFEAKLDRAARLATFNSWSGPTAQTSQSILPTPAATGWIRELPKVLDDSALPALPPEVELLDQIDYFENATRREI